MISGVFIPVFVPTDRKPTKDAPMINRNDLSGQLGSFRGGGMGFNKSILFLCARPNRRNFPQCASRGLRYEGSSILTRKRQGK